MGCRWKRCVQLPGLAGKTLSLRTFTAPSSPAAILEATHCRQWGQGWKELGLPLHYLCERSAFIMWSLWDVRVYLCHQLASPWLIYCFLIWENRGWRPEWFLRSFRISQLLVQWLHERESNFQQHSIEHDTYYLVSFSTASLGELPPETSGKQSFFLGSKWPREGLFSPLCELCMITRASFYIPEQCWRWPKWWFVKIPFVHAKCHARDYYWL